MFHEKFLGSGETAFAENQFKRFKAMTEGFTGKQVKTLDVVQEEYQTIFYYKLVKRKPNYEPLTKALVLLKQIDESVKVGNTMSLKMDVTKAITYVKDAML